MYGKLSRSQKKKKIKSKLTPKENKTCSVLFLYNIPIPEEGYFWMNRPFLRYS